MLNEALWHAYAERMIDGAAAAAALACFLLLTFYFHAAPRAAGDGRVPTLVVLGSGGHTTEMLRLLGGLDASRYGPVTLVVAASDTTSAAKAVPRANPARPASCRATPSSHPSFLYV